MNIILKIVTFIVFSCGIYHETEAIHGGLVARPDEFQYTAFLSILPETICTGAVISKFHILTAGNCVWKRKRSDVSVLIGHTIQVTDEALWHRDVENIAVHKKYKPADEDEDPWFKLYIQKHYSCFMPAQDLNASPKNDIAILTLTHELPLGHNVQAIPYKPIHGSQDIPCKLCQLAGWGKKDLRHRSIHLHWTLMTILSPQECETRDAHHRDHEFCAMDLTKKTLPLEGDTGSALVCSGYIVGILSTLVQHVDYPSTFVKVEDYQDFIDGIVHKPKPRAE